MDLIDLHPDTADLELLKNDPPLPLFFSWVGQGNLVVLLIPLHCYFCCCFYHLLHVLDRFSTRGALVVLVVLLLVEVVLLLFYKRWVGAKGQTRGKAPTKGGANILGEHTLPFTDFQQMRRGMNSLKDLEHVNPD